MMVECISRFLTIKSYQNAVSIFNPIIPVKIKSHKQMNSSLLLYTTRKQMELRELTFLLLPHRSHFQYVLNEGAAELAKICIGHMIRHPKNANKRVPSNLKDNKTIPDSKTQIDETSDGIESYREIRGGGRRRRRNSIVGK